MNFTNELILYFYSYSPGLLLASLFWWADRNKKPAWTKCVFAFLWGSLAALITYVAWQIFTKSNSLSEAILLHKILNFVIMTPLVEEIIKALGLFALWKGQRIQNLTDGIIYGLFIGFGFASTENIFYALQTQATSGTLGMWYQLLYRSSHTLLLHGSTTAILGALIGYSITAKFYKKRFMWPIVVIVSTSLHSLWNLLGLFNTDNSLLATVLMNLEILTLFFLVVALFVYSHYKTNPRFLSQILSRGLLSSVLLLIFLGSSYYFFISSQAKSSREYQIAKSFLENSPELKEKKIDSSDLSFQSHRVFLKNEIGMSELKFSIPNKATVYVELTRIADFWIVYTAKVQLSKQKAIYLQSSYEKALNYLIDWDLKDYESSENNYDLAQKHIADQNLIQYLKAKHRHLNQNYSGALQLLSHLEKQSNLIKPTLFYDQALVYFDLEEYQLALENLQKIEITLLALEKQPKNQAIVLNYFSELPRDPLAANFNPQNVLAKSLKLKALIYYNLEDFENGIAAADQAIKQSQKINSSVVQSTSLYIKALNLHASGNYKLSEIVFDEVISDIDNPNLAQKSWSYFFKSDIARRENQHDDALDYLELAITLDPQNSLIRKQAVSYLMERNYLGDLEIALGIALRGIDFGIEKSLFIDLSSQIYKRLDLPDKTEGNQ